MSQSDRPTQDARPFEFISDLQLHIVELALRHMGDLKDYPALAEYADLDRKMLLLQAEQEKLRREAPAEKARRDQG